MISGFTVRTTVGHCDFAKGGKTLLSLYPAKESFTAQIIIGPGEAEKAFSLTLGENVRKVLESANEFREGRWLFVKVESKQDARDIQELLLVKSKTRKREM
jgi:hypothetical protein